MARNIRLRAVSLPQARMNWDSYKHLKFHNWQNLTMTLKVKLPTGLTFTSICKLYKSFWLASILKDLHSVLIQHMSWKIIYSYFRNGISASLFYLGICLYFCENKTAKCCSTNIRTYTRCKSLLMKSNTEQLVHCNYTAHIRHMYLHLMSLCLT